jgi:hypothetical protein
MRLIARDLARIAPTVSKALRIALVGLGVGVALYGVASLTGEWLGTPPWWNIEETWIINGEPRRIHGPVHVPRAGDAWWAAGVIAAGLALAAFAAWPRRSARAPIV